MTKNSEVPRNYTGPVCDPDSQEQISSDEIFKTAVGMIKLPFLLT